MKSTKRVNKVHESFGEQVQFRRLKSWLQYDREFCMSRRQFLFQLEICDWRQLSIFLLNSDFIKKQNSRRKFAINRLSRNSEFLAKIFQCIKPVSCSFEFEWLFNVPQIQERSKFEASDCIRNSSIQLIGDSTGIFMRKKNIILQFQTSFSHCTSLFLFISKMNGIASAFV